MARRAHHARSKSKPWGVLLPWLLTGLILVATGVVAFWPREPELRNPGRPGEEGALIWGDGVFTNALELEAWLRVRGVSYKQWARRHPHAVKLLAPPPGETRVAAPAKPKPVAKPKPAPAPAPKQGVPTKPKPVAPAPTADRAAAAPASESDGGSLTRPWALGALLLLLALLGGVVVAAASRFSSAAINLRGGLLASAAAVVVGVAVASLLS